MGASEYKGVPVMWYVGMAYPPPVQMILKNV